MHLKEAKLKNDIDLCKEIGQCLYNAAPDDAKKIIMKAELSSSGDSCKFEYDYINQQGKEAWFLPENGRTAHDLRVLLTQHRDFFVSQGETAWVSCEFIVDVEKGKFFMNLKHD
jgi:hypothetical protein